MSSKVMPHIETVVFLMLENRSLDSLLGWLYETKNPANVYPPGSSKIYNGLQTGSYSNPTSTTPVQDIPVTKITDSMWTQILNKQCGVPYSDPWEALRAYPNDPRKPPPPIVPPIIPLPPDWSGVMNQFYGNSEMIKELPVTRNGHPAMKGFLQDYYWFMETAWKGHDILWTYTPEQLPVINCLARNFAVSDQWFCSLPSETNPNRAFSLCGTSLGQEDNGPYRLWAPYQQYDTLTLFNQLSKQGKSWKLYYTDTWSDSVSFTEYTFPQIPGGHAAIFKDNFKNDALNGNLPNFCYIEPHWTGLGTVGNDYHPPSYVGPGERFLQEIFVYLRSSPQWENMLFIVTFDEHGGTYDHVPPPGTATNPDGHVSTNGFLFNQYGARVPTLLISPYIAAGTVFRSGSEHVFDHTSFIRTLLAWAGMENTDMNLGLRALNAPMFDGVLSDAPVNESTDCGLIPIAQGEEDEAVPLHTAGTNEEVQALVAGLPGAPTKAILATCKTKEEIEAAVATYHKALQTS